MPTKDSSKEVRDFVIRHAHETELSGHKGKIEVGTKELVIPHVCGCTSIFAPTGWSETGDDGVLRDVWKQIDFKFNETVG